jgi:hypothetical protein
VLAIYAFELIADLVPEDCPTIIESVIVPEDIEPEIDKTLAVFAKRTSEARKPASSRRPQQN